MRTLGCAEGHAPVVLLQRRYRLFPGLDLQLAAVLKNKLLLVGAVRQGQQTLHQLQEAGVLTRKNTARSHDRLTDRREEEEEELLRHWVRRSPPAATPAPPW